MDNPKIGKRYVFVRRIGSIFEQTEFTRWDDGSAGFCTSEWEYIFEEDQEAWRLALAELASLGFVEEREAIQTGIVPSDWKSARDTHALPPQDAAQNATNAEDEEEDEDE